MKRFSLLLALIWSLLVGVILVCGGLWVKQNTIQHALVAARHLFDRELELITWLALNDNPEKLQSTKTIDQESAGALTRQFMTSVSLQKDFFLTKFDDKTLRLPGNEWLQKAYETFTSDVNRQEYFEEVNLNGNLHVKVVKPLVAEKSCLSCHAKEGFHEGDLLGGMGVSIPVESLYKYEKNEILSWVISIVGVWLIGLYGIWLTGRKTRDRLSELNQLATQLVEQEQISANRESLFNLLFDSIAEVVVIVGMDRTILAVNEAFVRLSGYREEEAVGRTSEFLYSDKRSFIEVGSWIKKNAPDFADSNVYEAGFRKKDGSVIPCEVIMSTIFNAENEVMGFVSIVRDISMRKQAELEERIKLESKEIMLRLEGLREAPLEKVCLVGLTEGTTLFESEFGIMHFMDNSIVDKKMLFWSAVEKTSENNTEFADKLCEEYVNLTYLSLSNIPVIHNDIPADLFPSEVLRSGGQIKRCLMVPVVDEGRVIFTVVFANKKTPYTSAELLHAESLIAYVYKIVLWQQEQKERKQFEYKMQEMQKMKAVGTLAGGIAHDLNNLLGIIFCNVDMALDDVSEDMNVNSHILRINEAANRGKEIVEQLLAFTRDKKQSLIPLNPAPLMNECLKLLRSTIPSSINLTHNISREAGTILANPTQFEQVLINLFYNAVHALSDETGTIHVTGETVDITPADLVPHNDDKLTPGPYFKMSVCDTGVGIRYEDWEKIYEPFYTTKGEGRGTGLGLSVAMGIIRNHGGTIQFESEPGRGTTFHAFFPLLVNEDVQTAPQEEQKHLRTGSERILLVDDEVLFSQVTSEMLDRLGYNVTTRSNGEEALSLFQEEPDGFDLVITDQVMPLMNGTKLAEKILVLRPEMPIILCTGYKDNVSIEEIERIGIRAICKKPFKREQLLTIIGEVLESDSPAFLDTT